VTQPPGNLPATGLPITLALIGAVAVGTALGVRRRLR
jgi:hypothetical protein